MPLAQPYGPIPFLAHSAMYGASRLAQQKRVSIAKQHLFLRKHCPHGNGCFNKNRTLTWNYETTPTPLSRIYSIRIVYRLDATPKVFVVSPNLRELANGQTIPHLYSQQRLELCLYKPGKGEWAPSMFLTDTILPWVNVWLFCFEEWLFSGEWKGGGEHPNRNTHWPRRTCC